VIVWVAGAEAGGGVASVLAGGGGVIAGGAPAVAVVVFNKALAAAWNASKVLLPLGGGLMALTIPMKRSNVKYNEIFTTDRILTILTMRSVRLFAVHPNGLGIHDWDVEMLCTVLRGACGNGDSIQLRQSLLHIYPTKKKGKGHTSRSQTLRWADREWRSWMR
jgi:hypothetical protein